ncbi:unnamed protein product [Prorocentrum cordatum]|uniref:Uncharacterized protein n=1 Tax=Prorocentrum cordatum TaxID=2364126 RepID=A0ABN9WIP1_9DINO|nr:unnamed protein product [Polarella glacialis]
MAAAPASHEYSDERGPGFAGYTYDHIADAQPRWPARQPSIEELSDKSEEQSPLADFDREHSPEPPVPAEQQSPMDASEGGVSEDEGATAANVQPPPSAAPVEQPIFSTPPKNVDINAVKRMALDVGSMASGGDEDVVMKGLVNFYKSPAMQALIGTKKRAPPTVELTQEDQDEKEMWERLQAKNFEFITKGRAGNPIAGRWQREINNPKSDLKERYAAVGTGRTAQMNFRKQWASDKYNEYKRTATVTETHSQEWMNTAKFLTVGRIAWKFGGGKVGMRAAVTHCTKALQMGEEFYEFHEQGEIMLFLFGEKGFNEGFKKAWTKHEEWTSTIANASGTQVADMKRPAAAGQGSDDDSDPAPAKQQRARGSTSGLSDEDAQKIKQALEEHIIVPTDAWYATQKLDGPQDSDVLVKNKTLLVKLRKIQPQGIAQSALHGILYDRAKAMEGDWHLADEASTWATEKAKHIRSMMRHVYNACRKETPPKWAAENFPTIGDDDGGDGNDGGGGRQPPTTPPRRPSGAVESPSPAARAAAVAAEGDTGHGPDKWKFEYDKELQAAWRIPKRAVKGKGTPEYASLETKHGVLTATFADGVVWEIGPASEAAPEHDGEKPSKPFKKDPLLVVWSGQKSENELLEAKITKKKQDEWLTLWNHGLKTSAGNSTAVLQLRGYPSIEWGKKCMADLGQKYIEGWDKAKLEAYKKSQLSEAGVLTQRARKRPAVAAPADAHPADAPAESGGCHPPVAPAESPKKILKTPAPSKVLIEGGSSPLAKSPEKVPECESAPSNPISRIPSPPSVPGFRF